MRRHVLMTLAALAPACGQPTPPGYSAPLETLATPLGPAAASVTPSAIVTASLSASASSGARSFLPDNASTPAKIQCETVECDLATEVCCIVDPDMPSQLERCVPKPQKRDDGTTPWACGTDHAATQRSCDEEADCRTGERCCVQPFEESAFHSEECSAHCWGERCLAGSTCSNGNVCATPADERGGECPLAIKPPACGKAKCKLGERCCWDAEAKQGHCAADCGDALAWFECTSDDQCAPGYDCNAWVFTKQFKCGGSGFLFQKACRTKRDCPNDPHAPQGQHAPAKACADTGLPPGMKECVYD